jgi:hypothetical protein
LYTYAITIGHHKTETNANSTSSSNTGICIGVGTCALSIHDGPLTASTDGIVMNTNMNINTNMNRNGNIHRNDHDHHTHNRNRNQHASTLLVNHWEGLAKFLFGKDWCSIDNEFNFIKGNKNNGKGMANRAYTNVNLNVKSILNVDGNKDGVTGTGSETEHQTPSVAGATSTIPKIESLSTPVVVVVGGSTARHQIQMMVIH